MAEPKQKPKKLFGFPYKYKCDRCGRAFTWDKDKISHQRNCKK